MHQSVALFPSPPSWRLPLTWHPCPECQRLASANSVCIAPATSQPFWGHKWYTFIYLFLCFFSWSSQSTSHVCTVFTSTYLVCNIVVRLFLLLSKRMFLGYLLERKRSWQTFILYISQHFTNYSTWSESRCASSSVLIPQCAQALPAFPCCCCMLVAFHRKPKYMAKASLCVDAIPGDQGSMSYVI